MSALPISRDTWAAEVEAGRQKARARFHLIRAVGPEAAAETERVLAAPASVPLWPGLAEELAAVETLSDVAQDAPPWPPVASEVTDPRPDLETESAWWWRLLRLALVEHGAEPAGTYAALHAVRCLGARLVRTGPARGSRWRIVPATEGSPYAGDWDADRATCLLPQRKAIAALLGRLEAVAVGEQGEGERR